MPQSQYSLAHKQRQATGAAKPKDNNSMTIEGDNVIDESSDKFPKVPEKQSPQLPSDDPYLKHRTSQT